MWRFLIVLVACLLLIGSAGQPSRADEWDMLRHLQIPVEVQPGKKLRVKVDFHGGWANCLCIYDHRSGRRLKFFNNKGGPSPGNGEWVSETNATKDVKLYVLVGVHMKPIRRVQGWHLSQFKVLTKTALGMLIGFEDGGDSNFTDILVDVEFVK